MHYIPRAYSSYNWKFALWPISPLFLAFSEVRSFFFYFCFLSLSNFYFYFCPCHVAWRILVPWPRIKPGPPSREAQSLSHGTTRWVLQRMLHATVLLQRADSSICFCQPKEIQTSFSIFKEQKLRILFSVCLAAGKVQSPSRQSSPSPGTTLSIWASSRQSISAGSWVILCSCKPDMS